MEKETFEVAFQKLEESVAKLEEGQLTLEESLNSFEEGIKWSKQCYQFLDKAEKRVETILKDPEGTYTQSEFKLEP